MNSWRQADAVVGIARKHLQRARAAGTVAVTPLDAPTRMLIEHVVSPSLSDDTHMTALNAETVVAHWCGHDMTVRERDG